MPNPYETKYIFTVSLQGETAVKQAHDIALRIRQEMEKILVQSAKEEGGIPFDIFDVGKLAEQAKAATTHLKNIQSATSGYSKAGSGLNKTLTGTIRQVNTLTDALIRQREALEGAGGALAGYTGVAGAFSPNTEAFQQAVQANINKAQPLPSTMATWAAPQAALYANLAAQTQNIQRQQTEAAAQARAERMSQLTTGGVATQWFTQRAATEGIQARLTQQEQERRTFRESLIQQRTLSQMQQIEQARLTQKILPALQIPTQRITPGPTLEQAGPEYIWKNQPFAQWGEGPRQQWFSRQGVADIFPERTQPLTRSDFINEMSTMANQASMKVYGLRHLGYGFRAIGADFARGAQARMQTVQREIEAYVELADAVQRTAQAMELPTELIPELEHAVLDLSVATGRFDPETLAEGMRVWAAGMGFVITNAEDMNTALEQTVSIQQISALNNTSLEATIDAVAGAMLEYGMSLDKTQEVSEQMNFVAAKTFANIDDLGQALKMVGPVAAQLNVPLSETVVTMGLLSDANIRGQTAGRALRQMFVRLSKPTNQINEVMESLLATQLEVGQTWQDIVFPEGQFIGLAQYIDLLAASTENLNDAERQRVYSILATAQEIPALTHLIEQQIDAREENINAIRAFDKIMRGVHDEETERYKTWVEQTTGMPFTMQSATQLMETQWESWTESVVKRWQSTMQQFENVSTRFGDIFMQSFVGPLETAAKILDGIAAFIQENPILRTLVGGGIAFGIGASYLSGTAMQTAGQFISLGAQMRITNAMTRGVGAMNRWNTAVTAAAAAGDDFASAVGKASVAATAAPAAGSMLGSFIGPTVTGLLKILGAAAVITIIAAVATSVIKKIQEKQTLQAMAAMEPEEQGLLTQHFRKGWLGGMVPETELGREAATQAWADYYEDFFSEQLRISEEALNTAAGQWITQAAGTMGAFGARISGQPPQLLQPIADYMGARPATYGPAAGESTDLYDLGQRDAATLRGLGIYSEEEKDAAQVWAEHVQDMSDLAQQHYAELKAIDQDYMDWRKDAEKGLADWLRNTMRDYHLSETRYAEDYERSRTRILEGAQSDRESATRDHVNKLADLYASHMDTIVDLLEQGDARGLVKQIATYKRQREQEERGFRESRDAQESNTAQELRQLDEDYELARERRKEDFALQVQDRKDALAEEMEAQEAARDEALLAAEENYAEQREEMSKTTAYAFAEAMGLADKLREEVYPKMLEDAEKFMEDYRNLFIWPEEQEATEEEQEEALKRLTYSPGPTWIGGPFGGGLGTPALTEGLVTGTVLNQSSYEITLAPNVTVSGVVGITEEELNLGIKEASYEVLNDFLEWINRQGHGIAGWFGGER